MAVSQHEAGGYVRRKEPFKGSHIYAEWWRRELPDACYCVFSYGPHFPMYVFDCRSEQWFGNNDRYSVSTTRHQSVCRPPTVHHWYDTEMMQEIVKHGFNTACARRLRVQANREAMEYAHG